VFRDIHQCKRDDYGLIRSSLRPSSQREVVETEAILALLPGLQKVSLAMSGL